jgi:hypothetical protein
MGKHDKAGGDGHLPGKPIPPPKKDNDNTGGGGKRGK